MCIKMQPCPKSTLHTDCKQALSVFTVKKGDKIYKYSKQTAWTISMVSFEYAVDADYSPTMQSTKEKEEPLTARTNYNKLWVVVRQLQKYLGKQKLIFVTFPHQTQAFFSMHTKCYWWLWADLILSLFFCEHTQSMLGELWSVDGLTNCLINEWTDTCTSDAQTLYMISYSAEIVLLVCENTSLQPQ